MRIKNLLFLFSLLLSTYSCDPFSSTKVLTINLDSSKLYIISRIWGVGGGHSQVVISKNKRIENTNLDLGESLAVIYSLEGNYIIIYTYKDLMVPNELKELIKIKHLDNFKYSQLLEEVQTKNKSDLKLYRPFE